MSEELLDRFAEWAGVLPSWHDLDGRLHETSRQTKRALLNAMGYSAGAGEMGEILRDAAAETSARLLAAEYVVESGVAIALPLAAGGTHAWRLDLEDGSVIEDSAEGEIHLAPLKPGYHRLHVGAFETFLIAAPPRAPSLDDILSRSRAWGVMTALYGLRSDRNSGLGDYADLAALAAAMGKQGAEFIGINPVHAIGAASRIISPYSPSHRLFLDTRHIALDVAAEEIGATDALCRLETQDDVIGSLRHEPLVDYQQVDAFRAPCLRKLFEAFDALDSTDPRKQAFADFRAEKGGVLERYCLFETLSGILGDDWRSWPDAFRAPDTDGSRDVLARNGSDLRFHAFMQWLADRQMAEVQRRAKKEGMGLGLYTDLAVGVRPNGAEAWAEAGVYAEGVSLGAPPDYFNPDGQYWGLLPFNPVTLRAKRYKPFIDTLRTVARHAGMIRIDHVISLSRSFWVPGPGEEGGFVQNSFDTLLAIVRIEAWRARCVVIGEDLGIVPPGFRERTRGAGILGCCVMQFERADDGRFINPRTYPEPTLASFGTHDTPTLAGFWAGNDIDERRRIGQIDDDGRTVQSSIRARDRADIQAMAGLPDDRETTVMSSDTRLAVHGMLAKRGSALLSVQLTDMIGDVRQPNMPGTIDEYPNWRVRDSLTVGEWSSNPDLREVSGLIAKAEVN